MSTPSRVYGTLDGMRGVAAFAVVLLHAPALFGGWLPSPNGGLAVDLFFVMSGFIIAHAYEAKMQGGALSRGRFMVLRLIRLYPLYFLGLLLGIAEAVFEIKFGRSQVWTTPHLVTAALFNAPMLPAPSASATANIFPMNPPGWSLFFEIVINAAYAVALPRLGNRTLMGVIAVAAAALVALGVWHGNLNFGSQWGIFGGGFARVAYSFPVGVLLYRLRERWTLQVSPLIPLVVCGAAFMINAGPWTGAYHLACVLLLMPGLVILGAATEPGPRLWPTFRLLGLTSYAVYSLHYPLVMATEGLVRKLLPHEGHAFIPGIGFAFLGLLTVGCVLIDRIYDTPVRRWLTRLQPRKPAAAGSAAE